MKNRVWPADLPVVTYRCDEDFNPIPEPDVAAWAHWFTECDRVQPSKRSVARDSVRGVDVSTVFLGNSVPSNDMTDHEPCGWFFETMVFGPPELMEWLSGAVGRNDQSIFAKVFGGVDIQRRYKTVADARKGHAEVLKAVTEALASMN